MKTNQRILRCTALLALLSTFSHPLLTACAADAVKADYSTPVAAARSYFNAGLAGDAAAIRNACLGSSEQKEMAVQFMRGCMAAGKLDAVATAKFGREETVKAFSDELQQTAAMVTDSLAALTNSDVKVDGTNAVITPKLAVAGKSPDAPGPELKLQQVAGQWKVLLDVDVAKSDFGTDLMAAVSSSQEECAADIRAGKYATAAEAREAQHSAQRTMIQQKQKDAASKPVEK